MTTQYDIIIIGAGITGIYLAYKLRNTNMKMLIIEKNDYIGGRMLIKDFYGKKVSMGAGVIRPDQTHIINLIKKLNLETVSFQSSYEHEDKFGFEDLVKKYTQQIKDTYERNKEEIKNKKFNFYQFLINYFDKDFVDLFIKYSEYNDYLDADVEKTIMFYPLQDILIHPHNHIAIKGGWTVLLDALKTDIQINLNQKVLKIENNNIITIQTDKSNYTCSKLFVCGDYDVNKIEYVNTNIEQIKNIHPVEFLRIYAYIPNHNIKQNIKSRKLFDKTIIIDENIIMICYCDSEKASEMIKQMKNRDGDVEYINKLFPQYNGKIVDFIYKYWKNGIHYYGIDSDLVDYKIDNKIIFLGEMVSNYQGWVEGSIRTVDNLIQKIKNIKNIKNIKT